MPAVTLDAVMLDLSYLLGESSVPSPAPADRQTFIQRTLERVYRAYDFDINEVVATVALTAGNGVLPSDARVDPKLDVRISKSGVGDDFIFTAIPYEQQDSFGAGDYRYWLTGSPGAYTVNTSEATNSSVTAVSVRYSLNSPQINSSISTPFPSSMCLARGALVYYRQAEDPQADIGQLEALFQQELEEIVATQIRDQADKPAVTRQQKMGTYTGDVDTRYFPSGF